MTMILFEKKKSKVYTSVQNFRTLTYKNIQHTVKPVLSGHSKIDKTKILKTNGSLMKVERIAEHSFGAFCNSFDLQ